MSGSVTVLDSLDGADGTAPHGGLIADANGDLFGTAGDGGPDADGHIGGYGSGTVFEIPYSAATGYGAPVVLADFAGAAATTPEAGLVADANGDLFGTVEFGGTGSGGAIFEIAKTANGYASTPTILASLGTGANPRASLIADANGDLFGTTQFDGAYSAGTVFELAKINGVYSTTVTTLASFNSLDGKAPEGPLITDAAGDLFGTTDEAGPNGNGTVFEIDKYATGYASTPTVLASFNGTDGAGIFSGLVADANGDLFGTSSYGGANNGGAIYEIVKTATGYDSTPIDIASFPTTPLDGGANGYLPADPVASLIIDSKGDLFGTSMYGGTADDGTVFEITKTATGYNSTPVILASLTAASGDLPASTLLSLASGGLVGTGEEGGADNAGAVFQVTPPPPTGPEIFSHVQAASSGALAGYYLWSNAANWTLGVPVNGEDAASAVVGLDDIAALNLNNLDLTGGGTVSATGQLTIQNLTEGAGSEAIASTLLPGGSGTAFVAAGTLSGSGGDYGAVGTNAIFDDESASSPGDALYLVANGGKFIVANALDIGGDSAGVLDVTAGGKVTSASGFVGTGSGTGIVTVDGPGSSWVMGAELSIGVLNAGNAPSVTVSDQASVTSSNSSIAEDHLIGGTLTLETGATLTEIELEMSKTATLNVDSGATLSEYAASPNLSYIGLLGDGLMNFDGGTLASANEQTDIGEVSYFEAGNGTLTASDGAIASNLATVIGVDAGDSGTLVLTGSLTSWTDTYGAPLDDNNAGLTVGRSGNGNLLMEDGATLTNPLSYIKIGQYSGSSGSAVVVGTGSSLSAGGLLRIGDSGQGLLNLGYGGVVSAGEIQVGDFAGSQGTLQIGIEGLVTTNAASTIDTGAQNGVANVAAGSVDFGVQSGAAGYGLVDSSSLGVGGDLTVGDGGYGSLAVNLGGVVTAVNANIGTGTGNSGTVNIYQNSTLSLSGSLTVGLQAGAGSPSLVVGFGSSVDTANEVYLLNGSILLESDSRFTASELDMHDAASLTVTTGAVLNIVAPLPSSTAEYIGLIANGILNFNAATLTSTNGYTLIGLDTQTGGAGAGTLTAAAGAIATNLATDIGEDAVDTGNLILTGSGTDWSDVYVAPLDQNSSGLNIGVAGDGSLTVEAGATLDNSASFIKIGQFSGSNGTALVTGVGSTIIAGGLLRIGDSGNGTLDIENAASVSAGQVQVGDYASSTGTLSIGHGAQLSTNSASTIDVGPQRIAGPNDTVGTLQVAAGSFDIGVQNGAQGFVDVDGGGLTVQGDLIVGNAGSGGLYVRNADVTADSVEIGAYTGIGSVTLASFGDLIAGSVHVGALGTVILEGGELDPPNTVTIDAAGDITGCGTIAGSVANAGSITAAGGTLELTGAIGGNGTIIIDAGADLLADAAVGAGQTVKFGGSPAALSLGDAADFSGTILNFAAGDAIDFENLSFAGTATLTISADDVLTGVVGGETLHLTFSGATPGTQFVLESDGKGGTEVQTTSISSTIPVIVASGHSVTGTPVGAGESLFLQAGAAASDVSIATGGVLGVLTGATASNTTISGVAGIGGTATGSQIENGGYEIIGLGGSSTGATIHQGGAEYVLLDGTATNTTIGADGIMVTGTGGEITGGVHFAGSDAVLSAGGNVLPSGVIAGFDQNGATDDAIILTGFTYAAGHDTATLGAGNVLTIDLNGTSEQLQFNPSDSNAGHSFSVTTNSLDQVVLIDPATGTTPNMDFLAPATAAGSKDVVTQILGRSAGLIMDIFNNASTSAAFQPALKNFAAIDTLDTPGAAGSSLASLNLPSNILSVIGKLTAHLS